jgi:hypothetical protein
MMKRALTPSSVALVALLSACSSSSTGTGPGTPDGGGPPPPVDSGAPSGLTQLATGKVFLDGVTDDGQVLYDDGTKLFSVSIAGGTPQMIAAFNPQTDFAAAFGTVALVAAGVNQTTGVGTLSAWTSGKGLQQLSTTAFIGRGAIAVAKDGSHVAFVDGVNGATANLQVAGSDGSAKMQLVAGVQLLQGCTPQVTFAGTSVVASYCMGQSADAAMPQANLSSFASGSTTAVPLGTGVLGYAVDPTGARVMMSLAGGISVVAVSGGTPTVVDATGAFGGFLKDGMNIIYTTQASALKRSPITSPSPVTLLASGAAQIDAVSPDESFALVSQGQNMTTGNIDLYIASAKQMGTATAIVTMTTVNLFGDAFTADSSHVLYLSNITTSANNNSSGTLNIAPTTGGAGTPVAMPGNVAAWVSLSGTKVLAAGNFVDNMTGGTVEFDVIDAAGGAPKQIATGADGFFGVTKDLGHVVYSTSTQTGAAQGLFVAPLQ